MTGRISAVWTLVLCGIVLSAGGLLGAPTPKRSETQPASQPTAEELVKINKILTGLNAQDPKSEQTVEDALAALGKGYLPALNKALSAQKDPLRRGVLDSAIVRLKWGVDPRRVVSAWLDKNAKKPPSGKHPGRLKRLADEALLKVLPEIRLTSLFIQLWPVARVPSPPLKSNNLFIITQSGSVQHFTDRRLLARFFVQHLRFQPKMKTDQAKQQAARAWLHLSQELQNDGMFRFTILVGDVSTKKEDGTSRVVARATVEPKGGDKGWIKVTVTFNAEGKLINIQEQSKLVPGIRPICQSTKLLDPDPIVRKMAETEILLMGRRCEPYIREQREKAGPELRKAIDRIWRRVLAEEAEWNR